MTHYVTYTPKGDRLQSEEQSERHDLQLVQNWFRYCNTAGRLKDGVSAFSFLFPLGFFGGSVDVTT